MVTTQVETKPQTQSGQGTSRYCEGCPRCTNPESSWCQQSHPSYNNLHPVCKRCGHCVLRGSHMDDADRTVMDASYDRQFGHGGV